MSQSTTAPSARAESLAHASDATCREAEKLLAKTASPDQAKRAVDSATGHPAAPSPENDKFARQWGFGSYLEMFEASKPLTQPDGGHCLVTHTSGGPWIVWDEATLSVLRTVGSLEEATASSAPPQKTNPDTPPAA
jgi:hypothetical protein